MVATFASSVLAISPCRVAKPSKGRNPQTGKEVDIPARNVPKFSAGKGLKDACN